MSTYFMSRGQPEGPHTRTCQRHPQRPRLILKEGRARCGKIAAPTR